MARKLMFGLRGQTENIEEPKPLDLWVPEGREKPISLYALSVESFKRAAIKFGHPDTISGFAVWGRWYAADAIYSRVDRLQKIIIHELRHIIARSNFNKGENHE